jgi:hypothetical protein
MPVFAASHYSGNRKPEGVIERRFKDRDVLLNGATAYADTGDQPSLARGSCGVCGRSYCRLNVDRVRRPAIR